MMQHYLFIAAAAIVMLRFLRGPSMGDRLITLNVLTSILALMLLWHAVASQAEIFLDVSIAVVMLSFVGMLALVRWWK